MCLLIAGNWYCSPQQENQRIFYMENLPPLFQPHTNQDASSNAHLSNGYFHLFLCLFSSPVCPLQSYYLHARTALQTLFDFSNSNCISAKQGFRAPVSTTARVTVKLNPMFPENRDSASTPHDHLCNYYPLPN